MESASLVARLAIVASHTDMVFDLVESGVLVATVVARIGSSSSTNS